MAESEKKPYFDKRANYAKVVTDEQAEQIWLYLEKKFGISPQKYKKSFSFAQNRRGRLWIASRPALEFVAKERFDPAKVLTCAIGKSDSKKLLDDENMQIRLTMDGSMFFNSDIKKNILYLTEDEEAEWYTGEVIDRTADNLPNDVYVLAQGKTKQVIGSSILKNGFLLNFVPKWRRPRREDAKDETITEPGL